MIYEREIDVFGTPQMEKTIPQKQVMNHEYFYYMKFNFTVIK